MSWVIQHRKTRRYVTAEAIFGLANPESYTADPLAAARFASREDAEKKSNTKQLRNKTID